VNSKALSLSIVFCIYVIAVGVAAWTALLLSRLTLHPIWILLVADIVGTVVVYLASLIFKNASVYDPYWSVAPLFLILGYYILVGQRFLPEDLILIIPIALWAIRLTYNWARGFENLNWQDWRYTDFKTRFPNTFLLISFFGIMLMPTLLVFLGMIPFYYLLTSDPNLLFLIIGGSTILLATIYQTISDEQKRAFRKNPENKGKCLDSGLWLYSRHPNYFGEIMVWWGVFICSLSSFFWLSVIGPILITLLFFFISVPLIEKHLTKNRPDYKDYKKAVFSPIIPLPFGRMRYSRQVKQARTDIDREVESEE
jgi:steroid 5-alpha reductase family enzyme